MQQQPPIIQYIVLLGNREQMPLTNIPPSTVVHPLLRHLGNLPQHMMHFIYGCNYYALLLQQGQQIGYNIKFCHPDTKDALLMIPYSEDDVYVFLVCTESEQIRQEYINVVSHFVGDNTLIIVEEGTGKVGGLPGNIVDNFNAVWNWFYEFCNSHYKIDYDRLPYAVPYFKNVDFYDTGKVFSPTRVNTQTFNAMLGNWGYEKELTLFELIEFKAESTKKAFGNKHGFDRQQELLDQIDNMYAVEQNIAQSIGKKKYFEDQFYSPLIIAAPYNSAEMRKPIDLNTFSDSYEKAMAKKLNTVFNYEYTENYTVDFKKGEYSERDVIVYNAVHEKYVTPRINFFDIVGTLHASVRFSPYLRLPILGKNINSELAFVGIKEMGKLSASKKANKAIRKVMERIGNKIVELTISPNGQKMLSNRPSQIVAMTDLPIEWAMIDGVPLAFTHDICRLPETPILSLLSVYEQAVFTPYIIPRDIISKTLVVFGNKDNAFVKAQEKVKSLSKTLGFHIATCLSIDELEQAISVTKPELLIIDAHGDVDENTHQTFLWVGNERLTGDIVVKRNLSARLVFLSACKTSTTCNTISTIGNAFFEAGANAVTTSYLPVYVNEATQLYSRLLRLLNDAATKPIHKNWLAFMAYLQRTSYIQSLVTEAKDENKGKINDKDLMDLINLTSNSMLFRNRKQIYKTLNDTNLARRMGVDFNNVIPHYLMYSTLGRADLIRFESDMKRVDELNIQNKCQ